MKFELVKGSMDDLLKNFFYLAWKACGGPLGMGSLQNRPGADIDTVWNNVKTAGDYPGGSRTRSGEYYADYVFGRMMKVGLQIQDSTIELSDFPPNIDYQAWCHKYADAAQLLQAAAEVAGCELQLI